MRIGHTLTAYAPTSHHAAVNILCPVQDQGSPTGVGGTIIKVTETRLACSDSAEMTRILILFSDNLTQASMAV